jgi:hypothetical protein
MRDVIAELKALRLHGMAGIWADLIEQNNAELERSRRLVEQMLRAETTECATRSVSDRLNAAKFPLHRNLAGFDFEVSPVNRKLVLQLAEMAFSDEAHKVVLVGGPVTGRNPSCDGIGVAGHRAAWQACSLLLDDGPGQRAGAGEGPRQGRSHCHLGRSFPQPPRHREGARHVATPVLTLPSLPGGELVLRHKALAGH